MTVSHINNQSVAPRTAGAMPVVGGQEKPAAPQPAREPLSFIGFMKGLIDLVNPLHHIPVVGAIYRHMTGDEIGPVTRIAGDALYGGVIGGAIGVADTLLEKTTGKDMGGLTLALLGRGGHRDTPAVAPASLPSVPPGPPAAPLPWDSREVIWSQNDKTAPIPREAVPARMAEALDKYAAMKQAGLAPSVNQTF